MGYGMNEARQQKALEALRDWSKWLIGINFGAATGCVVVLQGGVKGPPRPFLLLAIGAFAGSILCAAVLVRVLASAEERLPLPESMSLQDLPLGGGLTLRRLSYLQLGLLALGIVFFMAWVLLKPAPV